MVGRPLQMLLRPSVALLVAPILMLLALGIAGRFVPEFQQDSAGYRDFDFSSWTAALSQARTVGYPVWLKITWPLGGAVGTIWAQAIFHCCALILLYRGLRRAGMRIVTAAAAILAMVPSRVLFQFSPTLLPDGVSLSAATVAAAGLLGVLSSRRNAADGLFLIGGTMAAYHLRPAYLFLIPLWPILAFSLRSLLMVSWKTIAGVALGTVLPFLAYCLLRWLVVGHFGLVAFGGYNVVGITGQLLDQPVISELVADVQPFAEKLLSARQQHFADDQLPTGYVDVEDRFNPMVWELAVPIARELHPDDAVQVNQVLSRFSRSLIRARPLRYAKWLYWNAKHAVGEIGMLLCREPGVWLFLLIYTAAQLAAVFGRRPSSVDQQIAPATLRHEAALMLALAVGFAAAKIALVMLVEPAIGRYMLAAMVYLPAVVAIAVVHLLEQQGWLTSQPAA